MLYEVAFKHGNASFEWETSFVVYVEQSNQDFEMMEVSFQEIAVKQALEKFFIAGNALYEGSTLEILRIEEVDSEAL